ncbi:MAG: CBS domain-containing protein [Chthoniobacterales bacterium]
MNKKSATEAEKLVREGNLRQLPVLTREKRMVGIFTLEDIARETESDR